MGAPKFLILYFLSGIFGFVLGSNFALVGQPSVGASGAVRLPSLVMPSKPKLIRRQIFGTNAAFLVDLVAHWSLEDRPKRKLFWLVVEMVIGFGLGYVPGIDNFAHIGGFCMGLLCSIVLLPVVAETRVRKVVWIVLRIAAAALVVVLLAVLVRNFYDNDPNKMCTWCRYLSCWPSAANNVRSSVSLLFCFVLTSCTNTAMQGHRHHDDSGNLVRSPHGARLDRRHSCHLDALNLDTLSCTKQAFASSQSQFLSFATRPFHNFVPFRQLPFSLPRPSSKVIACTPGFFLPFCTLISQMS